jgi:hypothetical protein
VRPPITASCLGAALLCAALTGAAPRPRLERTADAWTLGGLGGIRGITVGPIENARHPGVGYGTFPGWRALYTAQQLGASWVSLTPFGRVWDLHGSGVDPCFEAPLEQNRRAVLAAIEQAHDLGLRVLLVPHLWVESGEWRALMDPGDDEGWARWAASYGRFLLRWAEVAEQGQVEMLSVGVEMRSWLTTHHAPSFVELLHAVRQRYSGLLTYSGNWDDIADTVVLGELDLIGVNAFYPLAAEPGASLEQLAFGGRHVAAELGELSQVWHKPVLLTEMGYTTRQDPAVKPWEWPDGMHDVVVDQQAQALAYRALLAPLLAERWFAGFFVWRIYADPDDVSQEAEWGFSPLGKLSELEVRDAFAATWAADAGDPTRWWLGAHRARTPGLHAWEPSPDPPWLGSPKR